MNRFCAILVIGFAISTSPSRAAPLQSWTAYLAGTWNCRSGSTPYRVTYKPALGGRWIRGINTSSSSQSEDMMTYDPRTKQWTVFDMEPSGAWSAMHGSSGGSQIRVRDARTRLTVVIDRVSPNEYHLEFRPPSGRAGAPDVCKRERSASASPAAAPDAVLSKMHHASFGAVNIAAARRSRLSAGYDE